MDYIVYSFQYKQAQLPSAPGYSGDNGLSKWNIDYISRKLTWRPTMQINPLSIINQTNLNTIANSESRFERFKFDIEHFVICVNCIGVSTNSDNRILMIDNN